MRKCVECVKSCHPMQRCQPKGEEPPIQISNKRVLCSEHDLSVVTARRKRDHAYNPGYGRLAVAGWLLAWRSSLHASPGFSSTTERPHVDPTPDDEDDSILCHVCDMREAYSDNVMVICEKCEVATHQMCYGILRVPEDDWFCSLCASNPKGPPVSPAVRARCSHCGRVSLLTL